jgi:hypothetical protein
MTQPDHKHEPDRFCIIPIYSDSTGSAAIPQNAVAHGSWSAITGRIRDSKQQRQMLTLINDAEHAKGTLQAIRAREQDIAAREDAVSEMEEAVREVLLNEFVGKLDKLAARLDALEQERASDPDDAVLPEPPPGSGAGTVTDEGDLQATHPPSRDKHAEQLAASSGTSDDYAEDNDAISGELPQNIERLTPRQTGTAPIFDPRKLGHPQDPPDQPIAIGDD